MKSINQVMEENSFLILDTVEEATTLAKDMRDRQKHCTCVIALEDNKFTVWPESTTLKAGIEPVETFHAQQETEVADLRASMAESLIDTLLSRNDPEAKDRTSAELMRYAIGCMLRRNGGKPLSFSDTEINAALAESDGFGIEASPAGFTITDHKDLEIH